MGTFKERIRQLRKQKNISQTKLAILLSVDKSLVSKWETGDRSPGMDVAQRIASYFSVSLDYLMGATDDPGQVLETTVTKIPAGAGIIQELIDEQKRQGIRTIDKVTAVNIMANNYGLSIIKRTDADGYVLRGRDGVYEVSEDEIDQVLNTMSAGIIEKLMYLEKDKQIEALKGLE